MLDPFGTRRERQRPWLIRERASSVGAERAWPRLKWWDEWPARFATRLSGAIKGPTTGDWAFARRVIRTGRSLETLNDEMIRTHAEKLRARLLNDGIQGRAAIETFALAREATRRALGFAHHPEQIVGARHILMGSITEMATGEGKTATTVLAAATMALAGVRVHVVTVNEYLRARDFETLNPIYSSLGIRAAQIDPDADDASKRQSYNAQIVHVTNKSLVFDYLRSRIGRTDVASACRSSAAVLGGGGPGGPFPPDLGFAIVDEADSLLIDEAQTPLIIAQPDSRTTLDDCLTALSVAQTLRRGRDYVLDHTRRSAELSETGRNAIATAVASQDGRWQIPKAREEIMRHALSALHLYRRDEHYIVKDDKIQIVDEFTGRVLEDRQWQAGLHQMVEAKETVTITAARRTIGQTTLQSFFRRYLSFGGMTGTIEEVARETFLTYARPIRRVPTHRRCRRWNFGFRLFGDKERQIRAIVKRAQKMSERGRPVLIGTRSVQMSEAVSQALNAAQIPHELINARQDSEEADIVAQAGCSGRITLATNMAGRGTDIKLTTDANLAGGLHVIMTQAHESRRVDRQLYGRAGRQGDPGSCEAILSLEDDVMARFAPTWVKAARWFTLGRRARLPGLLARMLTRIAQSASEKRASRTRRQVLKRGEKLDRLLAFGQPDI